MKIKLTLVLCFGVAFFWSCKNDDDDDTDVEAVEVLTWSEVEEDNDLEIQEYLNSHFYNYEEFQDSIPGYDSSFDRVIRIGEIAGDNAGKKPLSDFVQSMKVMIETNTDEGELEHTLYYIVASKGGGNRPAVVDSTYVKYEGSLLNGDVFDAKTGAPVWFDLLTAIPGFRNGLAQIKAGGDVIENEDGTFEIDKPGIGMIIMPSGMGYFSSTTPGEKYAPLVFKVELVRTRDADHDRDGVPTKLEDVDSDGDITNDDTDEDGFPDYFDTDDDGDGTLTNDEIRDENGDIVIPYPDTDNDGIPDYRDSDNS